MELLVVIAIISMLMVAASSLLRSTGSKSGEPAARIARAIEMARAQAVAGGRNIALRFDHQTGQRDSILRFIQVRPDGTGELMETRRGEVFRDIIVSPTVEPAGLPQAPEGAHLLADGEALVFNADGQVFVGTGDTGFPVAAGQLAPVIHIGVQPTRGGKVLEALRHDVAVVQVQGATGTARVLQPQVTRN